MDYTTSAPPVVPAQSGRDAKLIDLHGVFGTVRRRLPWILGTVAVVLLLTGIAYLFTPKTYASTASVALDRRVDEFLNQSAAQQLTTDSPTVDTAVQVLTSPSLAGEVVDMLDLAAAPDFLAPSENGPRTPEAARRAALRKLQGGLQVKRIGTSYAIQVSYAGPQAAQTAAIVNAVVDRYVDDQRTGRAGARDRNTQLLRQRIAQLRGEVLAAEQAVAAYRARTNLIDVQNDSTAVQQEISVLNTQLATAQAEEAAARARLAAAGSAAADTSGTLQQLRNQQAQLSAQRADLAGRYGPLHPDLARTDRQLADIRQSIATETARARRSLQADVQVAAGRTAAIHASLDRAQGGLMAGNNASVQLAELQRNADSARGLYQTLLDRYRQAVAGQGTEQSNAYVIAHALVPGAPASPNRNLFVAGGLLAGVLAAALVALLLELLERGFQSRQQVERTLGVPVLASVPDLQTVPNVRAPRGPMGPPDYLVQNQASVLGESFRSIRTALRLGHGEQALRSLAVCSALPSEGKTTVAICLARSAALAGTSTVLVDCDIRQRASSRSLADQAPAGLIEVLKGEAPLERALIRDEASGALILPQTGVAADYDRITSPAMRRLIAELEKRFDLVVLDTAPVLPLAEARAVAGMADGVLLVTRWRKTPVHATELAAEMLARAGAHVRGAALSLVNLKQQARAGHGDEMMYYKKFSNYYVQA